MADTAWIDKYNEALGKLLCDRAGLDPNRVLREYEVKELTKDEVMVTLPSIAVIPTAEFDELKVLAAERATA